MQQVLFMI